MHCDFENGILERIKLSAGFLHALHELSLRPPLSPLCFFAPLRFVPLPFTTSLRSHLVARRLNLRSVWVLRAKYLHAHLHYRRFQLFGLVPPALIVIR